MVTSLCVVVSVILLSAAVADAESSQIVWSEANCQNGKVTDIVCCQVDQCSTLDENSCDTSATCVWMNHNGQGHCKENRDMFNNVCCKSPVSEVCHSMTDGVCPEIYQVDPDCCSTTGSYPSKLLRTAPGKVCCNNPCSQSVSNGCPQPDHCQKDGPQLKGRSLNHGGSYPQPVSLNGYSNLGFRQSFLRHVGPLGQLQHMAWGGPITYTNTTVEEITVDDLINCMIDSMSNDKDVFTSSSEIYSDPLYGKQKFISPAHGLNYLDPYLFINQIYPSPNQQFRNFDNSYGYNNMHYNYNDNGRFALPHMNYGYGGQQFFNRQNNHGNYGYGSHNNRGGGGGGYYGYGYNF